jgi:hypothetical protein
MDHGKVEKAVDRVEWAYGIKEAQAIGGPEPRSKEVSK